MSEVTTTHAYSCPKCGARIEFGAGAGELKCPYCGHQQEVATVGDTTIDEHSYDQWAAAPTKPAGQLSSYVVKCTQCGAQTETDRISDRCKFCASPVVIESSAMELIVPEAVIPFQIDRPTAKEKFRAWVRTRWFAPSALKKVGSTESIEGTYLPHWTYDAETSTDYIGQRGEHYWETETYTEEVDGRTETRTQQVQKTHWYFASGNVSRSFDDVIVVANGQFPPAKTEKLGPWELTTAKAYQPDFLAGFQTLRYDVEPDQGLVAAKQEMTQVIESDCEDDIGGDEQRVDTMDTAYSELAFKLILLPVWIAAYLYNGKSYQVMVNANTGQVIGDRPYSAAKIAAAVMGALVLISAAIYLYQRSKHGA